MEPTSRLRVVIGEEELLRSRALAAVRSAVLGHHPDAEFYEIAAVGLHIGQPADVRKVMADWSLGSPQDTVITSGSSHPPGAREGRRSRTSWSTYRSDWWR